MLGLEERDKLVRTFDHDGTYASEFASHHAIGYPTTFGHPQAQDDLREFANDRSMPDMMALANDALHAISVPGSRGGSDRGGRQLDEGT